MSEMEKATDLRALERAYRKTMHGKRGKTDAIRFAVSPMEGLCTLKWMMEDRSFYMGHYTLFSVNRPVYREVKTCAFRDKIVLSTLCKNVLWEKIEPHLIDDNYASRKGFGQHMALDRLEKYMRAYYINHGKEGYVLRIDVRKYFYNLSHDAIAADMMKFGFDEWTIWMVCQILRSSYHSKKRGYYTVDPCGQCRVVFCDEMDMPELEVGSPIGNESSQVFAVQYANSVDHYIKDQQGCKYYGRYMDDSYIIHQDKAYLEQLLADLRKLYGERGLELNEKTQIYPLKNGVNFLGMHLYLTDTGKVIRRLRPKNVRYQRVHIRENAEAVAYGKMTEESYWKRFEAMDAHNAHADAKSLRKQLRLYAEEALKNAYRRKQRKLGEVEPSLHDLPGAEG